MSKFDLVQRLTRICKLIVVTVLLSLIILPAPAYADWPPFSFRLQPSYDNGRIMYDIRFTSQVDWPMTDLTFKLPLPPGTRFLEAKAEPPTVVSFDGAEITFSTFAAQQRIRNAYFIVEVIDPAQTTFGTYAWIAWNGTQPGEYVTQEEVVDTSLKPLNWTPPVEPRVQLQVGATAADDQITYTIYPTSDTGKRIWDLWVSLPLPEGTTFLSAEAPTSFVTNFDGQKVIFSSLELEARATVGPLRVMVSSQGVEAPYVTTYARAGWKNVGKDVGHEVPFQEETRSGALMVQPHATQKVVSDEVGDVPFANYDLVSLALSQTESQLEIVFNTADDVEAVSDPLEYILYVDQDCRADTGSADGDLGVDLRVRYRHSTQKTYLHRYDDVNESWDAVETAEASNRVRGNQVTLVVPNQVLDQSQPFCWVAQAKNRADGFASSLPADALPDNAGSLFTPLDATDSAAQ